jgi:hypothetical protein
MTTTRNELFVEVSAATKERDNSLRDVLKEWHTFMASTSDERARKEAELRLHKFMVGLDKAQSRYLRALSSLEDFDATMQAH